MGVPWQSHGSPMAFLCRCHDTAAMALLFIAVPHGSAVNADERSQAFMALSWLPWKSWIMYIHPWSDR